MPSTPASDGMAETPTNTSAQGNTLFTRSFSRTCPVLLKYPKSGRSVEGLAIIDDQASNTMVCPKVTEDLDIDQEDQTSTSNITTTVHGTGKPVQCLTIKNLIVTPLSGDASISIETAITHDLPDVLDDVPSPEEVVTLLASLALRGIRSELGSQPGERETEESLKKGAKIFRS